MSNLKKSLDKQLTSYMSKSRKKFSSEKPSTQPGDRSSGYLAFNDSLDSLIGDNPNLAVDQTLEIHGNSDSDNKYSNGDRNISSSKSRQSNFRASNKRGGQNRGRGGQNRGRGGRGRGSSRGLSEASNNKANKSRKKYFINNSNPRFIGKRPVFGPWYKSPGCSKRNHDRMTNRISDFKKLEARTTKLEKELRLEKGINKMILKNNNKNCHHSPEPHPDQEPTQPLAQNQVESDSNSPPVNHPGSSNQQVQFSTQMSNPPFVQAQGPPAVPPNFSNQFFSNSTNHFPHAHQWQPQHFQPIQFNNIPQVQLPPNHINTAPIFPSGPPAVTNQQIASYLHYYNQELVRSLLNHRQF